MHHKPHMYCTYKKSNVPLASQTTWELLQITASRTTHTYHTHTYNARKATSHDWPQKQHENHCKITCIMNHTRAYHEPNTYIQEHYHHRPIALKNNTRIIANHMNHKLHAHIHTRKVPSHWPHKQENHCKSYASQTMRLRQEKHCPIGLTNNKRIVENHTHHKPHMNMQEKHHRPISLTNNNRITENHTHHKSHMYMREKHHRPISLTNNTRSVENHTHHKSHTHTHTYIHTRKAPPSHWPKKQQENHYKKHFQDRNRKKAAVYFTKQTPACVSNMRLQRAACDLGLFKTYLTGWFSFNLTSKPVHAKFFAWSLTGSQRKQVFWRMSLRACTDRREKAFCKRNKPLTPQKCQYNGKQL